MNIPSGAIVTYNGQWPHGFTQSPNAVTAAVSADLSSAGLPLRTPPTIDVGIGGELGGPFTVTLQIQVENQGYASEDDLISIIRHWVFQEVGDFPVSDSVPFVQTPGSKVNTPTGQPTPGQGAGSPTPSSCVAGQSSDITGSFSLSCWFSNLTTKGLSTVGLLAMVVIVGVGIAIFAGIRPK